MVECQLPKLDAAGSTPVSRSIILQVSRQITNNLEYIIDLNIHVLRKNRQFIYLIILLISFFLSCGAKIEKNEKTIRFEARNFYLKGKKSLQADSIMHAEKYFRQALQVNPFFAPAYEGLGLIAVQKGDYNNGEKLFNNALALDANWVPAEIGLLQVKVKRKKYEEAVVESERINKRLYSDGYSSEVLQQLAEEVDYWKGIALKGLKSTVVYKLGAWESVKNIAEKDTITRAEFTAAFTDVFSEEIYQIVPLQSITAEDLPDSLMYYRQITTAIKYGVMKPYPDDLFRPQHIVKRAEIALIINNFLKLINKFKKDSNMQCKITDINFQSPIYKSICRIVNADVMRCSKDGAFYPDKTVSGYDVLQILLRLQDYIKTIS